MNKLKETLGFLFLTAAEILTIAYDSILYRLQREAAAWFDTYRYFAIRFIPVFLLGFLITFALCLSNKRKLLFWFALYFFADIMILSINHFYFLLYDFIGISFAIGLNLGGAVCMITRLHTERE